MNRKELIPRHSCRNCGECCGPVPINKKEFKEIQAFVNKNKPKYNKTAKMMECKFRVDDKCSIYTVRPVLCRLMGVAKGMACNFGNSKEIDGYKFLDMKEGVKGLINTAIKTNY